MIRMKPVKDVKKAEAYYAKSDGGYYAGEGGMHCEWGGKAAGELVLAGAPEFEQFSRLLRGLDPNSGEKLTAKLVKGRIAGWDVTASVPKGVTTALEQGDDRIADMIWQANRLAMGDLEGYATTRVRVGGKQENRVTGNLAWYSTEHAETRPVEDESLPEDHRWRLMPDPDRHIHNVIANLTRDEVEGKWKAVKFRPIMDLRKYFDRRFDHYLASMLTDAGYATETKWKTNGKYHTWDITGIPASVLEKFSRRSAEVGDAEAGIIAERKEQDENAPDHLSAVERDKLGATSRHQKRDDLTLAECREYWDSRITDDEGRAIAETINRARLGLNPKPERQAERAIDFAFRHHGEQESVFRLEHLVATAMERSMGTATPAEIEAAIKRPGVIVRQIDGKTMVTTRELQAEEDYVVGYAGLGLGTVCPVGLSAGLERGKLNDGQWNTVTGLLETQNRVTMVQGPAGAGKTSMLGKFDDGVRLAGQSATYLATTAKATEVLQKDGFAANTLARFLVDEKMQKAAKGGRVVVDESSMLGHKDAYRLFRLAERLNLKLVLVGDPMQHGSVGRGATMRLLTQYGGIKPFRLSKILRQKDPAYLAAATLLSQGQAAEGFDALDGMGWVREMDDDAARYQAVAADYVKAVGDGESVLLVSPTHAEASRITAEIRSQLREAGKLGGEHEFTRLVPVEASEAERGEASTYQPGQVLQFHQKAKGGFESGQRIVVTDPAAVPVEHAGKFQLYQPETIRLAAGDVIRFTGTVKTRDGEHTLRNGSTHAVAEITPGGNIRLDNGWVVGKDAGHFRFGYVDTSFSSQGKTVDRAILAMSSASLGATNSEQMYVSSSRARRRMTLYTDDKEAVREAIQESSRKLVALDLRDVPPKPTRNDRLKQHLERERRLAAIARAQAAWLPPPIQHQPERQASRGR
jgi:conjugative relaxase-like TrwC/TraI family protein